MAIRVHAGKSHREEVVAYIHGIDPKGDVAHILVHKKGKSVRFSGELGTHSVNTTNEADLTKWMDEAQTVWGLEDVIGVPRGWMNSPEIIKKMEMLNINSAKKKSELEARGQLQTS
ncbi:MAG TPA: hypothetical protein VND87_09870 [Stellaceae bacterium]|nr:hypothetical protein [Stellaceae bacterium]